MLGALSGFGSKVDGGGVRRFSFDRSTVRPFDRSTVRRLGVGFGFGSEIRVRVRG